MVSRRSFLQHALGATGTLLAVPYATGSLMNEPAFRMCLNPGSIGVEASQASLLELAIEFGFKAMVSMPDQLANMSDGEIQSLLDRMEAHDVTWGSGNLPVQFREDEARYEADLANLPSLASALQRAGATRMNTWIMPTHATLTYNQNFEQHARRLAGCASILKEHGIRLGLEYVGPKTLLTRSRYPFLRTMAECRELIAEIGTGNVGLVLDSFHWYCAEDSADDIRALTPEDVVTVDLNDARRDLSRDDQIDGTRELPGATGKINLKAFLQALVDIGYEGPVRAEPFNQPLRDMEDRQAVQVTYEAMARCFALV